MYSKRSNNSVSSRHLLTLEMYLLPTPAANWDKEQNSAASPRNGEAEQREDTGSQSIWIALFWSATAQQILKTTVEG